MYFVGNRDESTSDRAGGGAGHRSASSGARGASVASDHRGVCRTPWDAHTVSCKFRISPAWNHMDLPRLHTFCNILAHHPRYVLHLASLLFVLCISYKKNLLLDYIDLKIKKVNWYILVPILHTNALLNIYLIN